jgi:hypothetical protein
MKRFNSYLLEYLNPDQRERYRGIEMTDKARADTDHFFGVGNDKVHGEIEHDDKSEIHKQLENHLGRNLSHDEYRTGVVKDNYGRDQKIGRLIKDNNLRNQFDHDIARKTGYKPTIKTSTVRGVEVAGQTNPEPNAEHPTGHSWPGSCKNITKGINRHYLEHEIQHGTVVHFVHDHNGQEIYRATLHPHHNEKGEVAYSVDAEYGVKHPKFTESAENVAKQLSGDYKPGVYVKHPKVYNDSGETHMFHPAMNSSHIFKILKHGNDDSVSEVLKHPGLKPEHITHVLDHKNSQHRMAALRRFDVVTPEHVEKGLQDPLPGVRIHALLNTPHVTEQHLTDVLKNDASPHVRKHAINHPDLNEKHIDYVIKHDPDHELIEQALHHNNATADHVTAALDHPNYRVRAEALKTSKVNSQHIDKALGDENEHVRMVAVSHKDISREQLSRVINHEKDMAVVGEAVRSDKDVSPEDLHKVVTSNDFRFAHAKSRAAYHPNLSAESIDHIVKHGDRDQQYEVMQHHNISPKTIDYAIKHIDDNYVRNAISRNDNLTPEQISHMLKNDTDAARGRRLVWHPNATREHIDWVVKNHPHERVRSAAFEGGRFITPEHITHALEHDPSADVRREALEHRLSTPEHLTKAMQDKDEYVRRSAEREMKRYQG